jgi:multisubunit Na+/H+ antiporter MnhE subunit
MYISRLVKTRDPYPGLLSFAISSWFLFDLSPSHLYCLRLTAFILYLYLKIIHLCYLVVVLRSLLTLHGT